MPWSTKYAIGMAWVAALWREDFWSGMERFGGRELWPERVLGVRELGEETEWEGDDSEGWSSGDCENGIENTGKERRVKKIEKMGIAVKERFMVRKGW